MIKKIGKRKIQIHMLAAAPTAWLKSVGYAAEHVHHRLTAITFTLYSGSKFERLRF